MRISSVERSRETPSVFFDHLHSPSGVALIGDNFYVAKTDAIVRYNFLTDDLPVSGNGETLTSLPAVQLIATGQRA